MSVFMAEPPAERMF